MKKHYIIIGVLLVTVLFFIPSLVSKCDKGGIPTGEGNELVGDINERIEKIGKNPWNQAAYDSVMLDIISSSSLGDISVSVKESYLQSLDLNMQRALAISYEKSLSTCYANVKELNKASAKIKKLKPVLIPQKLIYSDYQQALGFQNKLTSFLAGKYSEEGKNNLLSNYQNAIDGKRFQRCTAIQDLKTKIQNQLNSFAGFYGDYNYNIEKGNNLTHYSNDAAAKNELKNYRYYDNDLKSRNIN
jgi:hypothetical protein